MIEIALTMSVGWTIAFLANRSCKSHEGRALGDDQLKSISDQ